MGLCAAHPDVGQYRGQLAALHAAEQQLHTMQAVADAHSAEQMQIDWLKAQMAPHLTQKLLRCTRDILKWIGAHDSDAKHQFPTLAGSHLPEVMQPVALLLRLVCL